MERPDSYGVDIPEGQHVYKTQTVRFELPFNCWCLGCDSHVGMGVRYNAEKKHVGMFHSTPIFRFRMKCHNCPQTIFIETDPENTEYKILEGLRKRIETYDPKDIGVIEFKDEQEAKKLDTDMFYRLEHGLKDEKQAESAAPGIEQIQKFADNYWKDPYSLSQAIRKKFRTEKKADKALLNEAASVQDKFNLSMPVLRKEDADDKEAAKIHWNEKTLEGSSSTNLLKPVFGKKSSSSTTTKVSKKTNDAKSKLLKLVGASRSSSFNHF